MVALFVVFTILLFLTADLFVQRAALRRAAARTGPAARREAARPAALVVPLRPLPDGVFLAPSHAWAELLPSGRLEVGAGAMVAAVLGPPDALELLPPGSRVSRGAALATLRRGDRHVALRSPLDGVVEDINLEVADRPSRAVHGPHAGSWLYRIRPQRLGDALRGMLIGDEAAALLRRETARVRDAVLRASSPDSAVGLTLLDGGVPAEAMASLLDEDAWRQIADSVFAAPEPPTPEGKT
jgi:glycine cleavage system H lipoate-binding protein